MARKPNYGFERREREKAKAEKKAERQKARQERKTGDEDPEGAAEESSESQTE
jgi:hypothetical protein